MTSHPEGKLLRLVVPSVMGILPVTDDLRPALPVTHQQLDSVVEFAAPLRGGVA
jgi:hypothetical protein